MGRKLRQIGPFLGLMTSVDAHAIPDGYAQDMQNVRIEDGKLRVRYGYSVLDATGLTPVYGFDHIVGYSGTTEVEEIIGVLTTGGNPRAHSINPSTGAETEITNGGSGVNLHASDWRSVAFEDKAYLINASNTPSVYQHTIGTNTSLSPITVPAKPTTGLSYKLKYGASSYTNYDTVDFTGLTMTSSTDCFCTGVLNGGSNANPGGLNSGSGFRLTMYSVSASNLDGSCTIDLDPNVKDWSYNDIFAFTVRVDGIDIDPGTIRFSVLNNDGSPVEVQASEIEVIPVALPGARMFFHVRAEFKQKTRADWDNIRKLKFSFRCVDGTGSAAPTIEFHTFTVGCVDCSHLPEAVQDNLQFAYSYRINASGLESERIGRYIGSTSYPLIISNTELDGKPPPGFETGPLGVWVEFTITASGDAAVDEARLYAKEQNGWRLVVTQSDATATYLFRMTIEELRALTSGGTPQGSFSDILGATPFKGWMVWLKKGGNANIMHSRVGEPLRLASDTDPLDDDLRGATFSMADNYGDEPVCAFQAGDALVILGKYGVYAQVGSRPTQMSPCRKIPGSFGVANQFAACRWRDEEGNPGVAFVSRGLEGVYFVQVDQSFDGDQGFRLVELSTDIRGLISQYFGATTCRMIPDDSKDALWIIGGDDALVLRKPSIVNGRRMWERYKYGEHNGSEYGAIDFAYVTSSNRRGKQAITAAGTVAQLEYSQAGSGISTEGSASLGQNILPLGDYSDQTYASYWKSKDFIGPNRRVIRCGLFPKFTETVIQGHGTDISVEGLDRTDATVNRVSHTQTAAVSAHRQWKRFGYKTQGRDFSYQVTFDHGNGGNSEALLIQRVEFEELTVGGRKLS